MSININFKTQKGFSLIELAIVVAFFGISMLSLGSLISAYVQNAKREKTIENLETVHDAIEEFAGLNGYYPCPANPTLAPGDAGYGESVCRPAVADPNNCDATVPAGIECTTSQSRDADGIGGPDVVVIGAVPFNTLIEETRVTDIRGYSKKDGYGALLGYAVTERLTDQNDQLSLLTPYNPLNGSISVIDENGNSLMDPPSEGQFVVFSFGEDGLGGHTDRGVALNDCRVITAGVPTPITVGSFATTGGEIKRENCDDNDAIFASGFLSLADNNGYYDDYVLYKGRGISQLWKRSMISPSGQSYLYNTNLGNVGVGTSTPATALHVMGDVATNEKLIAGNGYCAPGGLYCMDPDFVAGPGETCPNGTEVAYAVGSNSLVCRDVEWTMPTVDLACPVVNGLQSYLQGVSNLGNIYCCNSGGDCEKICETDPCPAVVRWDCTESTGSCVQY